ncbi:MAG: C40 family peptidase [Ezakiella sp.]|nr:C40 family peptidase [Ezakiella sp.]MDD7472036.1 C40 family peptidase [Bacillota bacterium]MDY3924000.1 C40 family peptidase [Ezakiella sp.]
MHKVIKNVFKVSGVLSILAFATFDTGTIINPVQVTTPSGIEVNLTEGEVVNISNSEDANYIIEKDGQKLKVLKNNVLLREIQTGNNVVKRITELKASPESDEVYRFLLENEPVQILKVVGNYSLVKTNDDLEGYALTENLSNGTTEKVNMAFLQADFTFLNNSYKKGDAIIVKNIKDGVFDAVDQNGKRVLVPKDLVRFQDEFLNRSDEDMTRLNVAKYASLLDFAKAQMGKPYVFGASGPGAFDCSGFTTYVFKQFGISLPRTSASQSQFGTPVDKANLLPGDLVFFNTMGAGVSHVGIYVGDGKFIHSATTINSGVVIDSLNSSYYIKTYVSARRVLK